MTSDSPPAVDGMIRAALAEDVGDGDWTTLWTVPADRIARAVIVAKADGVVSGVDVARAVFSRVDPLLAVEAIASDGDGVSPGSEVLRVHGPARGILTAERVALNFLQQLSGVASLTRAYVERVRGTGARVLDTRKTTPGLRELEKAAVRAGGGGNHRVGLFDMVLIKENHIAAAGGITAAVEAVRRRNDRGLVVEVETTTPEEVDEAVALGVDRILLDNMSLDALRAAVARIRETQRRRIETEASGGISLHTIREVAGTGVDFISVGALTHSPPALDLSLLVVE